MAVRCNARRLVLLAGMAMAGMASAAPFDVLGGKDTSGLERVGVSMWFQACLEKAGSDVARQAECFAAEYGRQDARLNNVFSVLMSHLPADVKSEVRNDERAWVAEKEKACVLAASASISEKLKSDRCKVSYTATRATKLETYKLPTASPVDIDEDNLWRDDGLPIGIRPSFGACNEMADVSMPAMIECSDVEASYQEARQVLAFVDLVAALPAADQQALHSEQKNWTDRRNKTCRAEVDGDMATAGQGEYLNYYGCLLAANALHATRLEHRLKSTSTKTR
jgi:uncharacterized protein YecT (DUF1311 family)